MKFSKLDFTSVFFVNSGAEANENALKLAFRMTSRSHVAAIEGSFHGRTAAVGAITWGAKDKWYGFPRAPFDVSFIPRRDVAAIAQAIETGVRPIVAATAPAHGLTLLSVKYSD